jgi:putative endonuclease
VTTTRRAFGDLGERLAAHHLEAKGYRIIERNYRRPEGEIDIIARQNGTIAFVEVKSRRGASHGLAREAITAAKAARLVQLAEIYAGDNAPEAALRIDLIAIDFAPDGRILSLSHYENAITEET